MDTTTTTTTSAVANLFEDAAAANTQAAQAMRAVDECIGLAELWIPAYGQAHTEIEQEMGKQARSRLYKAQVTASEAVNNARNASTRALTAAFNNGI